MRGLLLLGLLVCAPPVWAAEADDAQQRIAELRGKVAADPKDYRAWFELGVLEARRKHYPEAVEAFRTVVRLKPALPEPHNNLAVIYNEMGDLKAATRELEMTLDLNPDFGIAHENLADLYLKRALAEYDQALALVDDEQESAAIRARRERLAALLAGPRSAVAGGLDRGKQKPVEQKQAAKEPPQVHPLLAPGEADALRGAIEAWRKAWESRNPERYFAFYAEDFVPEGRFADRGGWRAHKRRVLAGARSIRVRIEGLELEALAPGRARVRFVQHYKSDRFADDVRKEMVWVRTDRGWRILRERVR